MTTRTVFICDDNLWARAQAWAQAGLIGTSLWLTAPNGPEGHPSSMPAHRLPDGKINPLGDFLGEETLDEIRVVWCAPSGVQDMTQHPWTHQGLEALRTKLGQQTLTSVAVFPATTSTSALPELNASWARVVVAPEETVLPDRAHAGTTDDQGRLLLTALALGRVVGGVTGAASSALADQTWCNAEVCAATYASTLVGGKQLDFAAETFHDVTLPQADAATISPGSWDNSWEEQLVDAAFNHVLDAGESTLRRLDTSPESRTFRENEQIGFVEFFKRFFAFVGFLIFHSRRVSFWARARNALADRLQAMNSGWQLERADEGLAELPVFNAFAMDEEHRSRLEQAWQRELTVSGDLPSAEALHALTATTNGMIDGSDLPNNLTRPKNHDRGTVVSPEKVLGCATLNEGLSREATEETVVIGEVTYQPASEAVVASARWQIREQLGTPSPRLIGPKRRGSAVVGQLIAEITQTDDTHRQAQAEAFEDDNTPPTLPYLDRLRAAVLAAAAKARFDANRFIGIAVGKLNGLRELKAATFRFLMITGCSLSALLAIANVFFQPNLISMIAGLGLSLTPGQLYSASAASCFVLISGPVIWYFYHFESYVTSAVRQAEARELVYGLALEALDEHRRLAAGERLVRLWSIVLRGIYPLRNGPVAPTAADVEVPKSWTVVEASYSDNDLRTWLKGCATTSLWRKQAFEKITSSHANSIDGNQEQLYVDHGLDESPLDQLADRIQALWQDYRMECLKATGQELREKVIHMGQVSCEDGQEITLNEFLDRVIVDDHLPGAAYQRISQEHPKDVRWRLAPGDGTPCPQVVASSVIVYQRPLVSPAAPTREQLLVDENERF